jgi:hypothetical protein
LDGLVPSETAADAFRILVQDWLCDSIRIGEGPQLGVRRNSKTTFLKKLLTPENNRCI